MKIESALQLLVLALPLSVSAAIASSQKTTVELVSASADQERFVSAVNKVLQAVTAKDNERFESYFTTTTVGMQPPELWRRAFVVLGKFGDVHKIEFSEMDGDAAFVKVHFARAVREFVVQLDDKGKLRELSYVPPPAHGN